MTWIRSSEKCGEKNSTAYSSNKNKIGEKSSMEIVFAHKNLSMQKLIVQTI